MLQAGSSRVRFPMRSLDFSVDLILPGVDSVSNRNEYHESSMVGKGRPERKADEFIAICESII
jgi:hypothetical protein